MWVPGIPFSRSHAQSPAPGHSPGPEGASGSCVHPTCAWLLLSWEPTATLLTPRCSQPFSAAGNTLRHAMPCYVVLTEPHAGCDGDEGHDAAEAAIDSEQCLVEPAGGWVGVVLVEEGEGSGGEGVEGSGGQQHSQVPALVLCCARQPAGKVVRAGSMQVPTHPPWHSPVLIPGVCKGSDQHQLDENESKATADTCIVPCCRGKGQ